MEVELSQLGRCQLDELCRAARLDLVLRTAAPLAAALQDDIRGLVQAAGEVAGLTGKVEFRAAELLALPEPRPAMAARSPPERLGRAVRARSPRPEIRRRPGCAGCS